MSLNTLHLHCISAAQRFGSESAAIAFAIIARFRKTVSPRPPWLLKGDLLDTLPVFTPRLTACPFPLGHSFREKIAKGDFNSPRHSFLLSFSINECRILFSLLSIHPSSFIISLFSSSGLPKKGYNATLKSIRMSASNIIFTITITTTTTTPPPA